MSEFNIEDFAETIERMSQGALLRLNAIQNEGLESMRESDVYYSEIAHIKLTDAYRSVDCRTIIRANLIDKISDRLMQTDKLADNLGGLASGMILSLADHHDIHQSRQVTPLMIDRERATQIASNNWLLRTGERHNHHNFRLYSLGIGSVALTSVMFTHDTDSQTWSLGYELETPKVALKASPNLGDIEIVEETS